MTLIDAITSVFCGFSALALFTVHAFSSPQRTHWQSLPQYVRWGFLVAGCFLMIRAVNFAILTPFDTGHTNIWGMVATISIAYAFTAFAHWVLVNSLAGEAWARIEWFKDQAAEHPDLAPVLLTPDELTDEVRAAGFIVAPSNGSPLELK